MVADLPASWPPTKRTGAPNTWFHGVWKSASDDEPNEYFDELDHDRWSIRCVRKFRDGRVVISSYQHSNWSDEMPKAPIPSEEAINSDPEFEAREITRDEFERAWRDAEKHTQET